MNSIGADFIGDHFSGVADEETAVSDGRHVPGSAFERLEFVKFAVSGRVRFKKYHFAFFSGDDQMATDEKDLPVAVAAGFPGGFAGRGFDTGEDRFIKPVNIAVEYNAGI